WKFREEESILENGLFYCLSALTEKEIKNDYINRVIVISDSPSNKSPEYQQALDDLISNIKNLPIFIDIIRIGKQRFYKDDVKLNIITSSTNGTLMYVENIKELNKKLDDLLKNKEIMKLRAHNKIITDKETELFYANLAVDLITPEPGERGNCYFCGREEADDLQTEYTMLLKCYNCGTYFHEGHLAKYALDHNLGAIYIFRCPNCGALLKLEKERVYEINGILPKEFEGEGAELVDEAMTPEGVVETRAAQGEIMGDQEPSKKEINEASQDMAAVSNEEIEVANRNDQTEDNIRPKVKAVPLKPSGFGFFNRPIPNNNNSNNNIHHVNTNNNSPNMKQSHEERISNAPSSTERKELKPFNTPSKSRKRSGKKFKLCPICGTMNGPYDKICKNCGSLL
ncbi:MAG: PHD finger domain-containing protein, partial [Promethearchaeota archaeon]